MTVAGWIFMLGSLAVVYSIAGWCYWQLLGKHDEASSPDDGE